MTLAICILGGMILAYAAWLLVIVPLLREAEEISEWWNEERDL